METILILLTVLATVASKNIPNTVYRPTKEQLQLIFGDISPNQTETPAVVDEGILSINTTRRPLKKDSNGEEYQENVPETVELTIRINVSDCDKQGHPINETVKVNKNINSTGDSSKHVKVNVGKGVVKIEGRVDDRVALGADSCPSGQTRVGTTCVVPD